MLLGRLIDVALARGITVVSADPAWLAAASRPRTRGVVAVAVSGPRAGVFAAPGRDVPTTGRAASGGW